MFFLRIGFDQGCARIAWAVGQVMALMACVSLASADAEVTIGSSKFNLPSPPGFVEVDNHPRYGAPLFESFTPADVTLLHGYVSRSDASRIDNGNSPELKRYMMSQLLDEIADFNLSEADFAFVIQSMKEEYSREIESIDPALKTAILDSERKASTLFDLEIGLDFGQMVPMENPVYSDRSVTHVYMVPVELEVEGTPSSHLMILGSNIVLIEGKAIYLNVYSNYQDGSDIEWVRRLSAQWLARLLE